MAKKEMVRDLTEGSIAKNLITYAAPLFVANSLQAIYNVVDLIVVGQVDGGESMAAVSIGGELIHLITFLVMGFAMAGQMIIAQFVGAGKRESITKMIGTMFTVTFFLATAMLIACLLLGDSILHLLNTAPEAFDLAKSYYITCITGIYFISGYNIICAILRGMGDSLRPFIFIGVASVLNIILDIWFVAGFGWSTFGAALATVIGQSVSFFAALIYLYRHRDAFGFDFKWKSFRVHREVLGPLIKLGIPMSIQMAAITFSKTLLARWINASGWEYTALSGIYNKLSMFIGIVSNSFTTAGAANVAQNIGAAKYERVPRILGIVALITGGICAFAALLVVLFPTALFSLFTEDVRVLEISGVLVAPIVICFIGACARAVGFSLINGSGNSRMNLMIAIFDGIIARIGLSYLLGFVMELSCKGFWLGDGFAGYMPLIVAIVFFITGRWKRNDHIIKKDSQ
ncbi:MAG: MATE family efflux transporter [Firmicutes bacterium]|nr:MATE family efflux transporter [Bacillota bacterium]